MVLVYRSFSRHLIAIMRKRVSHAGARSWHGMKRQADLAWGVPQVRDRIASRVRDAAESFKGCHVAPAVVCKGQEAGRTSQRGRRACPRSHSELVTDLRQGLRPPCLCLGSNFSLK